MSHYNILDSTISNVFYIDPDSILIKLPLPSLIFRINSDKINVNGNFSLVPEIIKNVYNEVNAYTLQVYKLSKIFITFKVSTNTQSVSFNNTYTATHTLLTSSMFIINDNFNLPNNIDISECSITSLKISANYVYGNDSIFSYITSTNPSIPLTTSVFNKVLPKISAETSVATAVLQNKLDFFTEKLESVTENTENNNESNLHRDIHKINNIIEKLSTNSPKPDGPPDHANTDDSHPYFTLYWAIPLSIIICVIVYSYRNNVVKYFRKKSSKHHLTTSSELSD